MRVWGKDRFSLGGNVPPRTQQDIRGTDDDALYQTERWYPAHQPGPRGYRIPLPPGSYRVALHFAETHFRETGKRSFDVILEGETFLEAYAPRIDEGETRTWEDRVEDGHLELELIHGLDDNPKISAIAIERIE